MFLVGLFYFRTMLIYRSASAWTAAQIIHLQNPCMCCQVVVCSSQEVTKSSPSEQFPWRMVPNMVSTYRYSSTKLNSERYHPTQVHRGIRHCKTLFTSVSVCFFSGTNSCLCGGKAMCVFGKWQQFILPPNSCGLENPAHPSHQELEPLSRTVS